MWPTLTNDLQQGAVKSLARCIYWLKMRVEGYEIFYKHFRQLLFPVIGTSARCRKKYTGGFIDCEAMVTEGKK